MSTTSGTEKRRITLTLPTQALRRTKRIARARKVNLSTVVAEALVDGLRVRAADDRTEEVHSYRQALGGFSDREVMLLDGIVLDL